MVKELSVDDVEESALAGLVGGGVQQRADRLGRATVLADHLADVLPRDLELDARIAIALGLADDDALGEIDVGTGA